MIKTEPPKPTPTPALPALLVFGKPTRADLPQAAWFRVKDRAAVTAAAKNMKFAIVEIKTAAEQVLLEGVYEGVLKGSGRMVVGSVSAEVFGRIEAHARDGGKLVATTMATAAASSPPGSKAAADGGSETKEQNMNFAAAPGPAPAPAPAVANAATGAKPAKAASAAETAAATTADKAKRAAAPTAAPTAHAAPGPAADAGSDLHGDLHVGSHVLAKFWEPNGEPFGWWAAVITEAGDKGLVAQWLDQPWIPAFKIDPKHITLPPLAFDPKREWDHKR